MHEHTTSTDTYLMGSTPEETQRLQRQAQLLDPSLRRLFEQAGIMAGMKVLDVGSGAGDVALLAASLVGPGGTVVGVEINPTILETARARVHEAGLSNVTFLAEDIESIQLDTEFDAIVGRAVLLYLRDPAGTLRKLAKHLRPGGVVAFLEADMARVATLPAHPPCQLWQQVFSWSLEAFRRAEVPLRMGLDMYGVFLDAGLPAPQMSCEGVIGAGPDWPGYDYYAETLRSLLPRILKFEIATAEEVAIETLAERLRTEATSHRNVLRGHDLISAWARKESRREHPTTYFVQDRENGEELTRVRVQDQMMTASMGGALPEQPDPTIFGRVLDVACGTGGWLIEAAKTYPSMSLLVGVDVNSKMIEYAQAQAEAQGLGGRVQFRTMDALRTLDFPNDSFDLVNQRFAASFLHLQDWAKLLQEYLRVTRPGGVIRVTEGDWIATNNSPALTSLMKLLGQAFYQAGHSFTPDSKGVTGELADLLQKSELTDMQRCAHTLEFRPGTASGQRFVEDMQLVFRTSVPFLRKWTRVPDDYEMIYQQALREMHQPDFMATGSMLTVWGNKALS